MPYYIQKINTITEPFLEILEIFYFLTQWTGLHGRAWPYSTQELHHQTLPSMNINLHPENQSNNSILSKDIGTLGKSRHAWLHPAKITWSNCSFHECLTTWKKSTQWLEPFQRYLEFLILHYFGQARTCLTKPNKNYMIKL